MRRPPDRGGGAAHVPTYLEGLHGCLVERCLKRGEKKNGIEKEYVHIGASFEWASKGEEFSWSEWFLSPLWENGTVDHVLRGIRLQSERQQAGRVPIVGKVGQKTWVMTDLGGRGLIHHGIYGDVLGVAILSDLAGVEGWEKRMEKWDERVHWWRKKWEKNMAKAEDSGIKGTQNIQIECLNEYFSFLYIFCVCVVNCRTIII